MTSFSSLGLRLAGTILAAFASALLIFLLTGWWWLALLVGTLVVGAAWYIAERRSNERVRVLSLVARSIAAGESELRSGLSQEPGALGELARALDAITEKLQGRTAERDTSEKVSLNRSFQQTVVSALGQFALVSEDLPSLLNQAVMLVSQTSRWSMVRCSNWSRTASQWCYARALAGAMV
jgi:hypothetical protein